MITKKKLEIVLSKLKEHGKPKPSLEQYTIPSRLAAEILNLAYVSGDIKGKDVVDLGCGSGRLSIGAAILGAEGVIGVDVDADALQTAKENLDAVKGLIRGSSVDFINADIKQWGGEADTVVQNPPFGIQKKHADRIFLERAMETATKVYSLHRGYEKSRQFITKFVESRRGKVKNIVTYKFRIPHMFRFHKKPKVEFDVDLYVIEVG